MLQNNVSDNHRIKNKYNQAILNSIENIENTFSTLQKEHNIDYNTILNILNERQKEQNANNIPISIFNNQELSPLESIVKYFREEHGLTFKKIANLLYRQQTPISITYNNAKKKRLEKLDSKSRRTIPAEIFSDKRLSVLEAIVTHLKTKLNLNLSEIGRLLNRNPRTIWTIFDRAKRKLQ